jgi:DNA (cytosine-5)-methyltransferase 1
MNGGGLNQGMAFPSVINPNAAPHPRFLEDKQGLGRCNEPKDGAFANQSQSPKVQFIDLFCGIGGFRISGESRGWECVFSSDIDEHARKAYAANFGHEPSGDITKISADDIPTHDVLFAGFPCQSFSIAGSRRGFADARGTLFFEVARIIHHHRPSAFVLENVAQLATHDGGETLKRILEILRDDLDYDVDWKILNAIDFGVPQNRTRIFIVGVRKDGAFSRKEWPVEKLAMPTLSDILQPADEVDAKHLASPAIVASRKAKHVPPGGAGPLIWHENKSKTVTSHPYSCALRAGASYNYLLVDGIRRLTPRECLRLQGFPDTFKIVVSDAQARKQAGNSVAVPCVKAVVGRFALEAPELLVGASSDAAEMR